MTVTIGDCKAVLAAMPANSVDSVVTDPPYELGFMGRAWDSTGIAYDVELWQLVRRVMKPGAHLLSFAHARTYHRIACAIEDAKLEIRDQVMWVYGSGFPKSADVSKGIDKLAGVKHPKTFVTNNKNKVYGAGMGGSHDYARPAPVTDDAAKWLGWGTALKPAHEPIALARKAPGQSVARSVLEHGTGGINVDGCRVDGGERPKLVGTVPGSVRDGAVYGAGYGGSKAAGTTTEGRWPANLIVGQGALR